MLPPLIILFIVALGEMSNNMVEAKYCPIEIDGDVKYYICPRNEICCTFGCCISSNFHFYQLWYYWLMVILMFLLCSGGTWWYRYWLQEGHYPPAPPPTHRPPPPVHYQPRCRRGATATYHPNRTTRVVVQHTWKPNRNGVVGYPTPPPSYSYVQHQTLTDSVDESAASEVVNLSVQVPEPKSSPYYQLYGPPPSYDSVMTEQRQNSNVRSIEQAHNSMDGYSENQNSNQNTRSHSQSDEDSQENTDEIQNSHDACVEMQEGRLQQGTHTSSSTSQSTSRSTSTRSTSRSHKHYYSKGLSKLNK